MDDTPKYVLCHLINKYSRSICEESGRLEGMLRDLCGSYKKEIFVLVHALKGGVASALIRMDGEVPLDAMINTQAARLCEIYGFSVDISRWATITWAEALGICSDNNSITSENYNRTAPNRVADDDTIIELIMTLGNERLDLRTDSAEELIRTGEYAVPFLIDRISNPDQGIRWRIAFILGEIGSPVSIKILKTMLNDPSDTVQEVAREALSKISER